MKKIELCISMSAAAYQMGTDTLCICRWTQNQFSSFHLSFLRLASELLSPAGIATLASHFPPNSSSQTGPSIDPLCTVYIYIEGMRLRFTCGVVSVNVRAQPADD